MNYTNIEQFAAIIGIDWADKEHEVCLKTFGSEALESLTLKQRPECIDEWARGLRKRFKGQPVAICLELKKGPLVHALLKYDFLILFPVNPQALCKYRNAFATSRAKDDPTDAALMVDLLSKHMDRFKAWQPEAPETRKLALLTEHRRRIVGDKVRLTNRLTSLLKGYYPQVLDWFKDKDTIIFCDFLIKWPTLKQAKRARKSTLAGFFTANHLRYQGIIDQRIKEIKNAMPLTCDAGIIEPSVIMVNALLGELRSVILSLRIFDKEINKTFASHDDAELFGILPGAGQQLAPRLLTAFGTDRDKWNTADDILKYSGIAPVLEKSGKKSWVHWRWGCPTFIRQSFVEWAGESIPYSFWAKAYYDQQKAKGNCHNAAVRSLAFKWIRIIFRCWKDHKKYNEATYLLALQKRGSSLLKNLCPAN